MRNTDKSDIIECIYDSYSTSNCVILVLGLIHYIVIQTLELNPSFWIILVSDSFKMMCERSCRVASMEMLIEFNIHLKSMEPIQ